MTYKFADDVGVSCGPVLTQPKETDVKTETLLQIYRFASAMEATLAYSSSNAPDYLLDECSEIISQLNVMIIARTNGD